MSRAGVTRALIVITIVGAIVRLLAWRLTPAVHPDEIYQNIEPAWGQLHGWGLTTWEWRDGVRSWVLPAYNGAWMAAFANLGIRRGATLGDLVQLHWALANLALLAAAFRGGCHVTRRLRPAPDVAVPGWQGGLLAAALVAAHPILVWYAPHTLSEMPSMLAFVFGLVHLAELRERPAGADLRKPAAIAGALLGLCVCIRIVNAPLVLAAPVLLLVDRRARLIPWLVLGGLAPVAVFGLVDLVTWGRFLGSYIGYVEFNLVRGQAAIFGTSPWTGYLSRLAERAPIGLPLLLLVALAGARATWPFLLSAVALVAALSTQGHKEERFIVAVWPLVLIAAAGVAGAWLAAPRRWAWLRALPVVAALGVVGEVAARRETADLTFERAWFTGQALAGAEQPTGLLAESILFCGGTTWFGRPALQIHFDADLLDNQMISHVLVRLGSDNERRALAAGFAPIWTASADRVVLLRRRR